jgi:hypothetical protein
MSRYISCGSDLKHVMTSDTGTFWVDVFAMFSTVLDSSEVAS